MAQFVIHFYEDANEGTTKRLQRFHATMEATDTPSTFTLHTDDGFEKPDHSVKDYLNHLNQKLIDSAPGMSDLLS